MFKLFGRGSPNLVETLSYLRTKALRKRIWFQALTTQERILTGLIRNNVKIVRNATLATVIARIIVKLISELKNAFSDKIEKMGRPIAEAWARGASTTGWNEVSKWVDDVDIVKWFGLMAYYANRRMWIGSPNG